MAAFDLCKRLLHFMHIIRVFFGYTLYLLWYCRFGKKSHPIKIFVCIVCCCCCCSAYLSSCHRTASDANLLDDPDTFHYPDYFVIGGIRTCLEVFDDPMFLWISSNSCPPNLLLVRITKQR